MRAEFIILVEGEEWHFNYSAELNFVPRRKDYIQLSDFVTIKEEHQAILKDLTFQVTAITWAKKEGKVFVLIDLYSDNER